MVQGHIWSRSQFSYWDILSYSSQELILGTEVSCFSALVTWEWIHKTGMGSGNILLGSASINKLSSSNSLYFGMSDFPEHFRGKENYTPIGGYCDLPQVKLISTGAWKIVKLILNSSKVWTSSIRCISELNDLWDSQEEM